MSDLERELRKLRQAGGYKNEHEIWQEVFDEPHPDVQAAMHAEPAPDAEPKRVRLPDAGARIAQGTERDIDLGHVTP